MQASQHVGLPKSKFDESLVCDSCTKEKHVRSLFKPKKMASTTKTLQLLHIDLCGSMRVLSKEGKTYVFFYCR